MPFAPDIIITTPEGVALVAEAKLSLPDLQLTEDNLKRYMVGMQCPIGLLVTPERMWVHRDTYTVRSPQSVERVGEFNAANLWQQPPPTEGWAFEAFVQQWLEHLVEQSTAQLPETLREALREYVLPAVASGDVRAAHPRYN